MPQFLSDGYFLAIAVQGESLTVVPRADWLITLPVFMLFAQEATVRGHDRSAQFAITDIWVKEPAGG
jgi:hypothetical protein